MIDFISISHRHSLIFKEYASFRQRNFLPIARAQERIKGIKELALINSEVIAQRRVMMPRELMGRKVDLLV